jgi:hypothetical protein
MYTHRSTWYINLFRVDPLYPQLEIVVELVKVLHDAPSHRRSRGLGPEQSGQEARERFLLIGYGDVWVLWRWSEEKVVMGMVEQRY